MKTNLDKFYTLPEYSKKCIDKLFDIYNKEEFDLIVEPSAGNGSFYKQIKHPCKIALDIAPDTEDTEDTEDNTIIKMDFFDYNPPENKKKIITIGNPPFGRVSSLAVKFFNKSSKWSSVIAFILPRTFRKTSILNRLNPEFHLIFDEDVPQSPCQFYPKMMVKCCFQIWEKKNVKREIIKPPVVHKDWEFLKYIKKDNKLLYPQNTDFAIRAYGGKIGEIKLKDFHCLSPKSWHWVKSNIDVQSLINNFNKLDYSNSSNTARQNSIGKSELICLYEKSI